MRTIYTRGDLIDVKHQLELREDWHEPDEQEVDAKVSGFSFDNAMGADPYNNVGEMVVILYHQGEPVASVNLATLFALASQE